MSLIINSIVQAVANLVVVVIEEAPKVLKALKEKVKEVRVLLETDGQHDRRIREMNRRELKQSRREMRMERRRGGSKQKAMHPNQVRDAWDREEWAAREMAALDMVVSAVKNDGDWKMAFRAYVSNG